MAQELPAIQPLQFRQRRRQVRQAEERTVHALLFLCAVASIGITVGIVVTLLAQSVGFFREVSLREFLGSARWTPLFEPQHFGVWPLVTGTVLVAAIAIAVAMPVGLVSASFLSEYAPERARRLIKPLLELLAGIPTVVYGYFALTFVTPQLQKVMPDLLVFNALSAGVVMGIMVVPTIASLSEDAMVAVPRSLREAAYALGATRFEVATRVVIPAALSGIVTSFILGFSRAVGETMLVAIAAGATPRLTLDPTQSVQTMTAYIAQVSLGETPQGTLEYYTIFAVGLILFILTLLMNIVAQWVVHRWAVRWR
ncbi:MAG: phosphate ABC transporter permease subunit PstC [Dehalococcoidia bacterium]|nr:phosphate ABC transporter permease subunit PstC [Dehalococcoidia bacterium]